MVQHEHQSIIVKKLFYLALVLTGLYLILMFLILGYITDDTKSLYYLIPIRLLNSIPYLALWFLFGNYIKDKRAALAAMGTFIVVSLFSAIFFNGQTTITFLEDFTTRTLLFSLPFLAFGLTHHKSWKGLLYLIPFVVFHGIEAQSIGFLFYKIEPYLRRIDLDDILSLSIPLHDSPGRSLSIYPLERVITYSLSILKLLLLTYFYKAEQNPSFKDFTFKNISLPRLDKVTFSIVFWLSRFVILSLYFGLVRMSELIFESSKTSFIVPFYILSFFVGVFVLVSLYRNYLTAYFVSQEIAPSWRFFFLNVPILNFFVWIHLMIRKTPNLDISIPETLKKLQKNFSYEKNANLKISLFLFIVVVTVVKVLNMNGADDAKFIVIINGVVSSLVLLAYAYSPKIYIPLITLTFVTIVVATFLEIPEIYFLATVSLVNIVFWFAIFHFDELNNIKLNVEKKDMS